jgi:hypothetical protein
MSARPTWRVPEAAGAAAGGLVSQRSAEAGSAAEVKTALTKNRLRCTSALQRAVEMATVSVQPTGSCRPRSPGRSLGVMPSSVSATFRPRVSPSTTAASSGTGDRGCSPASQRRTDVWSHRTFLTPRTAATSTILRASPLLDIAASSSRDRSRRFCPFGARGTCLPLLPVADTVSLTVPRAVRVVQAD